MGGVRAGFSEDFLGGLGLGAGLGFLDFLDSLDLLDFLENLEIPTRAPLLWPVPSPAHRLRLSQKQAGGALKRGLLLPVRPPAPQAILCKFLVSAAHR